MPFSGASQKTSADSIMTLLAEMANIARTHDLLKNLDQSDWQDVCPRNSALSGEDIEDYGEYPLEN